jgi:hypothetical protein
MKKENRKMQNNCYVKPAWTHNGSIRTDLPMTVFPKIKLKKLEAVVVPGQLCCVGKVFVRTREGLIRIM